MAPKTKVAKGTAKSKRRTGGKPRKAQPARKNTSQNKASDTSQSQSKTKGKENVTYRDFQVPSRTYNRWKPVTAATENFVKDIINTNVKIILSKVDGTKYMDVEEHLTSVRDMFVTMMQGMKVPKAGSNNYRKLQISTNLLEETLERNEQQLEKLDAEIERQERVQHELEDEKEKLESASQTMATPTPSLEKRLHPYLRNLQDDNLGLPSLQNINQGSETRHWEGLPGISSTHTDIISKVAAVANLLNN